MSETRNLLDHLQEQGYEPDEDSDLGDRYELIVSGVGTVRILISDATFVFFLDGYMVCEWSSCLSPGTPGAVIVATIKAAEWQLAERRGGPVTPEQAESI